MDKPLHFYFQTKLDKKKAEKWKKRNFNITLEYITAAAIANEAVFSR